LGDGSMILQTLAADGRVLKLAARSEAGASQGWTEFAGGSWEVCDRENELSLREQTRLDIAEIVARSTETKAVDTLYEELAEKGIGMGPAFRQLERVCAGPGFALGEVRVGSPPAEGGTGIHPALLDACLQTIQAAMPAALRGQAMLPVSVRSYRADDRAWRAADALFAFAELRRDLGRFSGSDLEADITVADRQGMLLAQMRGFRLRRVAAAEERPAPMWRTVWREFVPEAAEDQPGTPAAAIQSRWIVPGIGFGSGSASQASDSATRRMLAGIAAALEAQGSSVLVTSAVPAVSSSAAAVLAGSLDAVTRQVLRLVAMEHATPGLVG